MESHLLLIIPGAEASVIGVKEDVMTTLTVHCTAVDLPHGVEALELDHIFLECRRDHNFVGKLTRLRNYLEVCRMFPERNSDCELRETLADATVATSPSFERYRPSLRFHEDN
jgi:hypothetical protein